MENASDFYDFDAFFLLLVFFKLRYNRWLLKYNRKRLQFPHGPNYSQNFVRHGLIAVRQAFEMLLSVP